VKRFIARHAQHILGAINGFDRLVLRGSLRSIAFSAGLKALLWKQQVLLKDFAAFAQDLTVRVKQASLRQAQLDERPIIYLPSAATDKEAVALKIADKDHIQQGLIAILTCVEPCWSFDIRRNRDQHLLQLVPAERKCLHFYHYLIDPLFGFINARIQTWLPFKIQICLNGREWLARQMDRAGLRYERRDNCFSWIEDVQAAQTLMHRQLEIAWPQALQRIAHLLNPDHSLLFPNQQIDYYWSVYQSEWATDIMFRDANTLARIYPALVRHGILTFGSDDVMRFLGRQPHPRFQGEVVTHLKRRPEGIRLKHFLNLNSIKLYDKHASILRAETTLNHTAHFKVFRPKQTDPDGSRDWRPLRRGIADLHRRAQLSQACNARYLDAFATVDTPRPLQQLLDPLCRPARWRGRRARALRPWADDAPLLQAILQGQFQINGLRNRDLQHILYGPPPQDPRLCRRRSARVTRLIRLLRAHGLLRKVPRSHRYLLSPRGAELLPPILAARRANAAEIAKIAA
jgi:hypothetical protein